ncbi:ROK family transcriptional regulator [Streptomyces boncukensis]|uniref:ROK family transcriptional regulator n=1 Tax=Streptomyces boncukensis TaxID=2711219 RepID=A0A6G4X7G9_9ACTN|nr:ROK family transcriptional regulator [Streptomyces boncukensis]NGO73465.1 ROK family transcriptional regulator [Streptomyces boncukensis]
MAGTTPGTPRVLRAMNDRAALDLLLAHGPLSRGRIGKLTGLSKPTASQLLARLEAAGLVVVTGTSEGRPGPNAQLYAVNPAAAHVAALDVTSTRLLAAVADITGRTAGTFELPTPGRQAGADTVRQVLQAVDGAAKTAGVHRSGLQRIVIGTPGAFDPGTGRLRYASHLPGWHSPTLLDELAAALPMPLEYDNDVNLAAVAEQRLGAAGGHEDFVLLWNEQGLGAAVVIGGKLHRGRTGGAGEVGFLPVPGTPLVRRPGQSNSGGFQELAGANAVLLHARELGLEYDQQAQWKDAAAQLLAHAAERAAAGEGDAAGDAVDADTAAAYDALLRRHATDLATGLASVVALLDPELIVLSGGLPAAGGEPLRELVRAELSELAVPRPRLVLGTVTEHPVLSGALESALATTRDEVFDTSR